MKVYYTDLMEYANDTAAQQAWVSNAVGAEIDYCEYATDGAAQAAYVSSDAVGEEIDQQQTNETSYWLLGEHIGKEYRPGQSFKLSTTKTISSIAFKGRIDNSPTGNWTIRIETDDEGLPSGILAHENAIIANAAAINEVGYTERKYTFATPFELSGGVLYWWVILCDDQPAGQNRWYIRATDGSSDLYTNGSWAVQEEGSWSILDPVNKDFWFKIYVQATPNLQCYSEDTIIQQGSYSLKVVAQATDSLNDTLTKSGLSIDLSDKDELKIDVRASRTGTNLQARLYDSVGGWITKDINITSADTFQEFVWDISGVSNANKSNITKIEFKILNADSATTYYIDNFRLPLALQCYSEDTIKQQGSYSLKVIAAKTGSLNKTLTKTIASDYLDYSICDVIKLAVRSNRTGSNIKIKFHDTGGTTSEHTINVLVADTFQIEQWDISGIAAGDRDTIDSIIVEIINADSATTYYLDNLYSQVIVETSHVFLG